MKRLNYSLAFVILFAFTTFAQKSVDTALKNVQGPVSLQINAVRENPETESQIPVNLLDELTKVKFLKNIKLFTGEKNITLSALFVFTNYESFKEWYSAKETKEVFKKLSGFFNGKLTEQFSFKRY